MTSPITAGDTFPPLRFTLGDTEGDVDFSNVLPNMVHIEAFLGKKQVLDGIATDVDISVDGKTMLVERAWTNSDETMHPGQWRVVPTIVWGGGEQTFPTMVLEVRDGDGN